MIKNLPDNALTNRNSIPAMIPHTNKTKESFSQLLADILKHIEVAVNSTTPENIHDLRKNINLLTYLK